MFAIYFLDAWSKKMELRNLITFIHVAELGSFTQAGERLGYSQSTVSFQIKQLEQELGCLLFERINHTVTLTERGHDLVSYAHRVCALTDEFKEGLASDVCRGHIHIVTPDSVCERMMSTYYLDFHEKYPEVSVKFTTADTTVMFEMLDRNEADAIITLDSHSYRSDYVTVKEEALPMHFVASVRSPLAARRGLSLDELVGAPFILTEHGQGYRRVFDKELAKRSLEITPVLELGRTDIITTVLAKSDMVSYLPDFVTEEAVRAGALCRLDVTDVHLEIWKQLIHHKNKWKSRALRAVLDYVKEHEFSV
jgi:DNA-binding transcriptional LysR family regulator